MRPKNEIFDMLERLRGSEGDAMNARGDGDFRYAMVITLEWVLDENKSLEHYIRRGWKL